MIRPLVALILFVLLAPPALAGQGNPPLLALWEFDGWAAPTAERPLGLRFVLLEDGSVIYTPDDPASDTLIPTQYFQARLTAEEAAALTASLVPALQQQAAAAAGGEGARTAFYFRDPATGEERSVMLSGLPCLAHGRVFSATVTSSGLQADRNRADRAALPAAMHDACNRLTAFHHASTQPWSPAAVPAFLPQR